MTAYVDDYWLTCTVVPDGDWRLPTTYSDGFSWFVSYGQIERGEPNEL